MSVGGIKNRGHSRECLLIADRGRGTVYRPWHAHDKDDCFRQPIIHIHMIMVLCIFIIAPAPFRWIGCIIAQKSQASQWSTGILIRTQYLRRFGRGRKGKGMRQRGTTSSVFSMNCRQFMENPPSPEGEGKRVRFFWQRGGAECETVAKFGAVGSMGESGISASPSPLGA